MKNKGISIPGPESAAECAALEDLLAEHLGGIDPDLAVVIQAWVHLPGEARERIGELAREAVPVFGWD